MPLTDDLTELRALIDRILPQLPVVGDPPGDPDTSGAIIVDGPDEWGFVRTQGTLRYTQLWFLVPEFLRTRPGLYNEQQVHSHIVNVGCDDQGNIGPAGPTLNRIKPGTQLVSLCHSVVKQRGFVFNRWVPTTTVLPNRLGSRYATHADLVRSLAAGALT